MAGSDVQARLFVLAPGETIPWHHHTQTSDHYFVLEGVVTVRTRSPERTQTAATGEHYMIPPGAAHLITNQSKADCRFLLLQGIGSVDWVRETE